MSNLPGIFHALTFCQFVPIVCAIVCQSQSPHSFRPPLKVSDSTCSYRQVVWWGLRPISGGCTQMSAALRPKPAAWRCEKLVELLCSDAELTVSALLVNSKNTLGGYRDRFLSLLWFGLGAGIETTDAWMRKDRWLWGPVMSDGTFIRATLFKSMWSEEHWVAWKNARPDLQSPEGSRTAMGWLGGEVPEQVSKLRKEGASKPQGSMSKEFGGSQRKPLRLSENMDSVRVGSSCVTFPGCRPCCQHLKACLQ